MNIENCNQICPASSSLLHYAILIQCSVVSARGCVTPSVSTLPSDTCHDIQLFTATALTSSYIHSQRVYIWRNVRIVYLRTVIPASSGLHSHLAMIDIHIHNPLGF